MNIIVSNDVIFALNSKQLRPPYIQGEVTGDNVADFQIELDNMPLALGAADFVL